MTTLLLTRRLRQNRESGGDINRFRCVNVLSLFAFILGSVIASSCGGKNESLESRVNAYWQARIQGEAEKAFTFEVPGSEDKATYLKRIQTAPIVYTDKTIVAITEDGNEAEVKLQMKYLLSGLAQPVTSSMAEKWVKRRGQWYRQPQTDGDAGRERERG